MSLFEKFFNGNEEFLRDIEIFEKLHTLNCLEQLKTESNRENFLSAISELRFGLFLTDKCTHIVKEYRNPHGNQKPDYKVVMNDQELLLEVFRLNRTVKAGLVDEYSNKLHDALHAINVDCNLNIRFKKLPDIIDEEHFLYIQAQVNQWLQDKRFRGDRLEFESVTILFSCYNEKGGWLTFSNSKPPNDPRRLDSDNSQLLKKSDKYNPLIKERKWPYIICLALDIGTILNELDLYISLYGREVMDITKPFQTIYQSLDGALYYREDRKFEYVTGILLYQNGKYSYFPNPLCKFPLSSPNTDIFNKYLYYSAS